MKKEFLLLILLTGLVSLACNLPLNLQPASSMPTATPVQYTLGPTSVHDSLDKLNSYRTQLSMEFNGTRNGETAQGKLETNTEIRKNPPALHHTFRLDGQLPKSRIPAGVSEFYRLDGRVYLKKAGETLWSQFTAPNITPTQLDFLEPEQFITLPRTVLTPPITETLNNIAVRHYAFSETDLSHPQFIFDQAQGEVWLAAPGDYVVQYVISASVRVPLPDPKAHLFDQGQLNLRYTLSDVNADLTIAPPADMPTTNTLSNLPRLPDAEIISIFPDLVEYVSVTTPLSATQFYQTALADEAWEEQTSAVFEEKARLTFSKQGQILTIVIVPAEEKDKVKVILNITG